MAGIVDCNRKNTILFFYVLIFAIVCSALWYFRHENWFFLGIVEILLVFIFPLGALCYGYKTGDSLRSFLAGTLTYGFFILLILSDFQNQLWDSTYLLLFAGYHISLLLCAGLIGLLASMKEKLPRSVAVMLSVLWILIFLSGIN